MGIFKRLARTKTAPSSGEFLDVGPPLEIQPTPPDKPETVAPPGEAVAPEEPPVPAEGAEGAEDIAPCAQAPEAGGEDGTGDIEEILLAQVGALPPAASRPPRFQAQTFSAEASERADDYPAGPGLEEITPLAPEDDLEAEEEAADQAEAEIDPDAPEMDRLRRLLLGREIDGLADLRRQLTNPEIRARSMSRVITEALLLRTEADQKLDAVLKGTVERILRGSVRRNPAELADYLFPVMGPAIRRSISESLRGMLNDFSRLLEKSFTLTGLKWRLTAMRTGRTFSEVALLNNLEYQVEEIFLVHTKTGLPLLHLVNEGVSAKDAAGDQVAAMFTALQQFVSDSFAEGELNDLTFGDLQVCVVQAPEVYMACVVRGQSPPTLRKDMQAILELLVVELAEDLDAFNGDAAPFQKSRRLLDGLLVSRLKDESKKLAPTAFLLPLMLAALLLAPLAYLGYSRHRDKLALKADADLRENVYSELAGPGLWPVHISRGDDGRWTLSILKDELGPDPKPLLAGLGLDPSQMTIAIVPFISKAPEIVERRVALLLTGRPETLTYKFDWNDETLTLGGRASLTWLLGILDDLRGVVGLQAVLIDNLIDTDRDMTVDLGPDRALRLKGRLNLGERESLKDRTAFVSGLSGLDLSGLSDDDDSRRVKELLAGINKTVIRFPLGKEQPLEADRPLLLKAANDLAEMENLAGPMGLTVSLTIYGYTDLSGQAARNYELSQARARALAALLYERGSTIPLTTFGLGPAPTAEDLALSARSPDERKEAAQASRRIELKAKLDRARLTLDPQ